MKNSICSDSQQIQSQSVYSVDEFSEMLQYEANLNLNTATAISANLDQLDGTADGQITVQSFYDRRLLESAVDNQLCEVPSYKRLGLTSETLGLVQSGCRFQDIDAAVVTLSRRLDPNYVEQEPSPAVPVRERISEPVMAAVNNSFMTAEIDESYSAVQLLLQNRIALAQLVAEVENSGLPAYTIAKLRDSLSAYNSALTSALRPINTGQVAPTQVGALLRSNSWAYALTAQLEKMAVAVRSGTFNAKQIEELRGLVNKTTETLRLIQQSFWRLPNPAPVLSVLQPLAAELTSQGKAALEATRLAAAEARRLSLEAYLIPPGAFSTTTQTATQAVRAAAPVAQAAAIAVQTETPAVVAVLEEAAISTAGTPASGGFKLGAVIVGGAIAAGGAYAAWYWWWRGEE